jgi:uncharacterized Zn-finger protein
MIRKPRLGVEDLKSKFPEVAAEAYGWDPSQIFASSGKKLEWKCAQSHIFKASVLNRTYNRSGCPYCSGNKVLAGFNDLQTKYPELAKEAHGWDPSQIGYGSGKKLSWKCERNHIWEISPNQRTSNNSGCPYCLNNKVLPGFNDLVTSNPKLAAEANGWDPTRIAEKSLKKKSWICSLSHEWMASPADRSRGDGCPYCSGRKVLSGFNDLATTHPDLAQQAYGWDPKTVTFGSNITRKWICKSDHIWSASPNTRSNGETGCPYCSNQKVLAGFNDLKTTHPEIANQAYGWDPSKLTYGSNKRVRWRCENGHKWVVSPAVRSGKNGSGCPACAESGFNPLLPGWLYLLNHEIWNLQQIGITNFPEQRLKTHERLGWELIDLRGPLSGDVAAGWEKTILKHIKNNGGISPKPKDFGKFTGFTESWTKKSFLAKDIFSLMKETGEL